MNNLDMLIRDNIPVEKPYRLIASDRVEGTAVRRSSGEKIGNIERLMIDKLSGQVAYAVLSFGGFLGIGHKHFPIPWGKLHYNIKSEAYEVDLSEEDLKKAPSFEENKDFDWGDRSEEMRIHAFYRTPTYWDS